MVRRLSHLMCSSREKESLENLLPIVTGSYRAGDTHASGTTDYLIQSQELSDLLHFQLSMPTNRVFKRLVYYPKAESH